MAGRRRQHNDRILLDVICQPTRSDNDMMFQGLQVARFSNAKSVKQGPRITMGSRKGRYLVVLAGRGRTPLVAFDRLHDQ